MKNIVVLVSGGGTNLQALIDAEKSEGLGGGKITCVIASKPDAYALTRAADNGIKTRVLARTCAQYSSPLLSISFLLLQSPRLRSQPMPYHILS